MGRVAARIRSAAREVASGRPARRCLVTAHVSFAGGAWGGDGRVVWIAYAQAAGYAADMGVADLGLFLEGYVEGWISLD
ncbi:hypothetical protein [Streptomyces niveus]|uniref:hypothetical protein n=1 Tax=Streptomyces niveus TaxID=193462 RepID=UPI0034202CFD